MKVILNNVEVEDVLHPQGSAYCISQKNNKIYLDNEFQIKELIRALRFFLDTYYT